MCNCLVVFLSEEKHWSGSYACILFIEAKELDVYSHSKCSILSKCPRPMGFHQYTRGCGNICSTVLVLVFPCALKRI